MHKGYYAIIPANVRYDKDLSPNAKLLFGEISALCNEKGYCWANNSYFADLYNVSKVSISKWIKQLCEKGYIHSEIVYKEGSKEILNRYITILGEGTQEKFNTPTQEKFNTPIKEKFKDNNTLINNTLINNTTNNTVNIKPLCRVDEEFEQLWSIYPRKIEKKKAKEAFKKARKKQGVTYETIKKGLEMYVKYVAYHRLDDRKIKHGSTWFNNECWNDEYSESAFNKKQQFSQFTEIMLNQMDDPDEFLNSLGVDTYEPKRERKIIYASEG